MGRCSVGEFLSALAYYAHRGMSRLVVDMRRARESGSDQVLLSEADIRELLRQCDQLKRELEQAEVFSG